MNQTCLWSLIAFYIYHYMPVNVIAPHIFLAQIIVNRPWFYSKYLALSDEILFLCGASIKGC